MSHELRPAQVRTYFRLFATLLFALPLPCDAAESNWVHTGVTGRLIYVPDAEGDRILDFSDVGYLGRGTALVPDNVPTVVTLSPISGDDTANIQTAIDQVSALPLGPNGYRGAVLLEAGTYDIDSQLEIRASGVVLRGEGRDTNGTVLHGRNPLSGGTNPNQRPLIRVYGNGSRANVGSTRNMIDKVVPAGSRSFRVDSTSGFSVGDTVRIERPSTQAWIDAVGMDNPPNGDPPWQPGTMNVRYDRVITRIEGNRIFVDAPLANSFDVQFGGGTVREYSWSGAIENIGIENLRGDTDFTSATDEDHAWEFIFIGESQTANRAENVWVRNIAAAHFGDSAVVANPGSKWVTVDNAVSVTPVSQIAGERRYTFDLSGELGYVTNSQADDGRHDFVNNSTRPPGPNVFHNSISTNANNDSGPHQRWATGTLFDNFSVQGDGINARNRGSLGTSHGWSGANMVVWNSTADSFIVQNPPTAQNWLIGSTGTIIEDTEFGPQPSGNYDAHGTPVIVGGTTSLYEAQHNESKNIEVFHSVAGGGNWTDPGQWLEGVAPLDAYHVSLRDYLIGDVDSFVNDGGGSVDNAYIDPAWQTAITNSSALPLTGFDDLAGNQNVAFTIQHGLDAGEQVVHGFAAFGLKQGAGGMVDTDFIRLFDMDPDHRFAFSDLGWDTEISTSETSVGVLDLGMFLDELQTGSVNVQINDDTSLDWAIYTIAVATPVGDATRNSVFIDGGGTVAVDTAVAPVGQLTIGAMGSGTLLIASTGKVDIEGTFSQSATGSLAIEIAGDDLGQFGVVDVLDDALLGGALNVTLNGLFEPQAGDGFEIVAAANVSGVFSTTMLPDLQDGLVWRVDYQPSSVSLNVLFSADFDGNGTVDGDDLARWSNAYGSEMAMHSEGDADGDGDVDGQDFLIWQTQHGSSVPLREAVVIPEPDAAFLALLSTLFVLIFMKSAKI